MNQEFSNAKLKELLSDYAAQSQDKQVKDIKFNARLQENGAHVFHIFDGCSVKYDDGTTQVMSESDVRQMICSHFDLAGYDVQPDAGISFKMSARVRKAEGDERRAIPVFSRCSVEYQEKKIEMQEETNSVKDAPEWKSLVEIKQAEMCETLKTVPEQELYEMIRAHFESNATLPGEKAMKDMANQRLNKEEFGADPAELQRLAEDYSKVRVCEAPVKYPSKGDTSLWNSVLNTPESRCQELAEYSVVGNSKARVSVIDVTIAQSEDGHVLVRSKPDGPESQVIGRLPENFVKNHPMNVYSFTAQAQVIDFSNGQMKNMGVKVVIDTDLMSGDDIKLESDLFDALDKETGLEQ